ncbi:MAG: SRPBCC family protein [Muribaculaceae bacterium]|nr:SRPBCC family protein [Muribaculaceae bacterium]
MSEFKSSKRSVAASAEAVYAKLSDLSSLGSVLSNIPEGALDADNRQLLEQVKSTPDSVTFPAGPVGEVTLQVARRVPPTLISLEGVGTPVALNLRLEITPSGSDACEVMVALDIAIPAMLKPMVGGTLQKMADQFADVVERLNYE